MAVKLAYNKVEQFSDGTGVPYSGAKLFTYVAGSTTKQTTYTESTGSTPNTNPIVLDSAGRLPQPVWLTTGVSYKFVLAPSTDTDPPTSPIWTLDGITGVNDSTSAQSEWVAGPAPTYVSATQFTLVGDQTTNFHVGRKIKSTITAGTGYHTITASTFGALTTVTVNGSSLDSGLSAVSYGLVSATNSSVPGLQNVGDLLVRYSSTALGAASASNEPINFALSTSVGSSALTIAVKGRDGTDPSASNPVLIPFRNSTSATGDYSWLVLTSATSLVISSGSTMGFTNAVLGRLWIVGFNDAGTFRLGSVNVLSGTSIMPLRDDVLASSTAEGGIGGADSAQVIYTGTAVTTKALRVLGYLEATEATAGTWATTPSKVQIFEPGVSLPGTALQEQVTLTGTFSSGSTVLPVDNTIPQNTEGDQYMTQAITPTSAANVLEIEHAAFYSASVADFVVAALFQDATANALSASVCTNSTASFPQNNRILHRMLSATTSATTFKIRAGIGSAGTTYFLGKAAGQLFGGVANGLLRVKEIVA